MNPGLNIFKNAQRLQDGTSQLAQGKAPWDYFNPWGGTTKGGSGTGIPTQKAIGTGVGTATNFFFPGLGFITGPAARWITSMIQHGLSQQQVQQTVQQYQQQAQQASDRGEEPPTVPTAPPTDTPDTPAAHAGVGIDPEGNPADPGEWWSNDFGRWDTDKYGTTPGNYWNQAGPGGPPGTQGIGFGGNTVGNFNTAIGFGGSYGGGSNAGILRTASSGQRQADLIRNSIMAGTYNPTGAVHAPHGYSTPAFTNAYSNPAYGRFLEGKGLGAPQTAGGPSSVNWDAVGQAWQNSAAAGGIGSPSGGMKPNYGHTPKRAEFAMGTSDVNPGLKIFHRTQLKRKNQTK